MSAEGCRIHPGTAMQAHELCSACLSRIKLAYNRHCAGGKMSPLQAQTLAYMGKPKPKLVERYPQLLEMVTLARAMKPARPATLTAAKAARVQNTVPETVPPKAPKPPPKAPAPTLTLLLEPAPEPEEMALHLSQRLVSIQADADCTRLALRLLDDRPQLLSEMANTALAACGSAADHRLRKGLLQLLDEMLADWLPAVVAATHQDGEE